MSLRVSQPLTNRLHYSRSDFNKTTKQKIGPPADTVIVTSSGITAREPQQNPVRWSRMTWGACQGRSYLPPPPPAKPPPPHRRSRLIIWCQLKHPPPPPISAPWSCSNKHTHPHLSPTLVPCNSPATRSVRGELNTSAVDRREEPGGNSRTMFWEEEEEEAAEDAEEEDASSCRAALSWCALGEACSQS